MSETCGTCVDWVIRGAFVIDCPLRTGVMCKALYVITKENGQMPFPTKKAQITPTRWKQACIATKKAVIKKENGQIPFPTDRALTDADKLNTGLYRDKKP